MTGFTTIRRTILAAFALGMLLFGQLHTVAHVHHSHEDDLFPIEVSFHPIGVDAGLIPEHHDHNGEEHGHSSDHKDHARWFLARSQHVRQAIPESPLAGFVPSQTPTRLVRVQLPVDRETTPLFEQTSRSKSDPRAPPITI